jgi:hypothetical protein
LPYPLLLLLIMTLFLLRNYRCAPCGGIVRLSQAGGTMCTFSPSNHVFQDCMCCTQWYEEEMIFRKLYVNQSASVGCITIVIRHWQYSLVLSCTIRFAPVFSIFVHFIKVKFILLTLTSSIKKIFIRKMVRFKPCKKSTLRTAVFLNNFTPIYNALHVIYKMSMNINLLVTIQFVEFIGVKCFLPSCVYYLKLRADKKIVSDNLLVVFLYFTSPLCPGFFIYITFSSSKSSLLQHAHLSLQPTF